MLKSLFLTIAITAASGASLLGSPKKINGGVDDPGSGFEHLTYSGFVATRMWFGCGSYAAFSTPVCHVPHGTDYFKAYTLDDTLVFRARIPGEGITISNYLALSVLENESGDFSFLTDLISNAEDFTLWNDQTGEISGPPVGTYDRLLLSGASRFSNFNGILNFSEPLRFEITFPDSTPAGDQTAAMEYFRDNFAFEISTRYDEGYSNGYQEGYTKGYDEGEAVGYRTGYQDGKDDYEAGGVWSWFESAAVVLGSFLDIKIFPSFTIGNLIGALVGLTIILFFVRAFLFKS